MYQVMARGDKGRAEINNVARLTTRRILNQFGSGLSVCTAKWRPTAFRRMLVPSLADLAPTNLISLRGNGKPTASY